MIGSSVEYARLYRTKFVDRCEKFCLISMSLLFPGNEWLVPASSMDVFLRACTEQSLSIDAKSFIWSQCPCYFQVTNGRFQRRVWMYSCAPVPNKVCRSMRKVLFDLNVQVTNGRFQCRVWMYSCAACTEQSLKSCVWSMSLLLPGNEWPTSTETQKTIHTRR